MIRQAATEAVTREAVWPNKVTSGKTTFGDLILVVLILVLLPAGAGGDCPECGAPAAGAAAPGRAEADRGGGRQPAPDRLRGAVLHRPVLQPPGDQAAVMLHEVTCLLQDGRHHQDHQEGERRQPGVERGVLVPCGAPPRLELQAKVRKHFTIMEKVSISGFSWLKVPTILY